MPLETIFTIYNLVEVIWIILPAYAANGLVPLFKGKHPVDGGRKFFDGRPFLGPGKTWEGLFFGSVIGIIISIVMLTAHPYLPWDISPVPLYIAPMSIQLGFLLGFGAIIGDMAGSFIKRRLNIPRGRPAPVLDQDDFVLGSLFFASLVVAIKFEWIILALIITPIFHFIASVIAYKLKIKKEPW